MLTERVRKLMRAIEEAEALDPVIEPALESVQQLTGTSAAVKNALSGTWLGHRLHPLLTDVVIGTWMSAWILDLLGGRQGEQAADRLLAIGAVSSLPTALTGASDWSDAAHDEQHRTGLVHAAANYVGLGLQVASLVARRRGDRGRAKALSTAAIGLVGFSGYLGGHMSYVQGIGVDHPIGALGDGWRPAGVGLDDLIDGQPRGVSVDGVDVVLVRRGDSVDALAGTCIHAGGPLAEGTAEGDCITCPWHGSTFRRDDGSIVRAPAVSPQPVFATRVVAGNVEVSTA
jgi:nitrite reductase/ring-hydroxylating ferredoxin subunit/uncharacterized membrane protein